MKTNDTSFFLQETKPLYSFEDNGDYVYEVAWSPIHPALFTAVDGSGRIDLWNLNQDTEVMNWTVISLIFLRTVRRVCLITYGRVCLCYIHHLSHFVHDSFRISSKYLGDWPYSLLVVSKTSKTLLVIEEFFVRMAKIELVTASYLH